MLKIEKVKLEEITPYENNPKEHPRNQLEQICDSILQFGFNDPIGIDEKNVVIEGHGRYEALVILREEGKLKESIDTAINRKDQKALEKLKEVEGYIEKGIPCIRLTGLSEGQKKAYIIAHNKLTMNSDFDLEKLRIELEDIADLGINISLTGFEDFEVEEIKGAEVDVISFLDEEGFSSISNEVKNNGPTFGVTFNFPNDERKEEILAYINDRGKEYFVEKILEEVEGEKNA